MDTIVQTRAAGCAAPRHRTGCAPFWASLRGAARRRQPAPAAAAGRAVDRCPRRHRPRARAAAAAVRPQRPHRDALRPRRAGRRLPEPQHLDARPGSGRAAGHGLEPRRRLPLLLRRELRRQPLRPRRRGLRDDQLADRRRRLPLPRRRRRRRQPRAARPGRRPHLGAGQHQPPSAATPTGSPCSASPPAPCPSATCCPCRAPRACSGARCCRAARRTTSSRPPRRPGSARGSPRCSASRPPARRSREVPVERLLEAQAQIDAEVLTSPDPARWGCEVVASTMPFHPVVDGDVLPGAADRPDRRGSGRGRRRPRGHERRRLAVLPRPRRLHRPGHRGGARRTGRGLRLLEHRGLRAARPRRRCPHYRAGRIRRQPRATCWRRS